MENKITKNLIILGAIIFAFILTNNVSASSCYMYPNCLGSYDYDSNNYDNDYYNNNPNYFQNDYYNRQNGYNSDNNTGNPIIYNNYYYQTAPATVAKASTTSTTKQATSTTTTNKNTTVNKNTGSSNGIVDYNSSGYNGGSELTALSLRGSGGFMPSSIWQWIFVVILILAIIVIARTIRSRSLAREEVHNTHTAHAH